VITIMFGVLFFALLIAGGIVAANRLFKKTAWYVRAWTGIVIGLICAMWLVIPPAFLLGFGIAARLHAKKPAARVWLFCVERGVVD
jgi:hypothetical protein